MKATKKNPKLNVKLLRRIQKHILKEPRRFFMEWYIARQQLPSDKEFPSDNGTKQEFAPCGTAACIAGWATILSGKKVHHGNYHDAALAALGLENTNPFQAHPLFDVGGWVKPFRAKYRKAKSPQSRARLAAKRIEHFIKTGE